MKKPRMYGIDFLLSKEKRIIDLKEEGWWGDACGEGG